MSTAHDTANRLFAVLVACAGLAVAALAALLAMLAESLAPHILEFCLQAWQAVTAQWSYRAMFFAFIALAFAALAFILYLWRIAHDTQRLLTHLLGAHVPLSPRLVRLAASFELETRLDLVQDERPLALCFGWRHPRILLTSGLLEMLDDDELAAVLAHEVYHLTHHDPLKILLVRGLRAGLFFLPIVHDLSERYLLAQELAADEETIRRIESRSALAGALYKMLAAGAAPIGLGVGAFSPLTERVRHLAHPSPTFALRISLGRTALSALGAVLLLFSIFHPMVPMPLAHVFDPNCHNHVLSLLLLHA